MSTPATHLWKPSSARVVVLDSFVPVPRGTTATAAAPLNWAAKDPADILAYESDIGPAVTSDGGDSITTLDVTIAPSDPGDLRLINSGVDGTRAILWLAAGQSSTVYIVTISIGTAGGRSVQRSILLPVLPLSIQPVSANALQVAAGVALTDQNGNPILIGS
jgi:hypothetical protein